MRATAYATLYSPPPIHASNSLANSMRWRPTGERRTMHSPSEIRSSLESFASRIFMLVELHGGESTVHGEVASRDEAARLSGAEEDDRPHELGRLAEAVHRRVGEDLGDPLGLEDLAVLLGGEEAGRKRVHADSLRGPLAGQVHREIEHGGLRGAVGEDARKRTDRRHRRD